MRLTRGRCWFGASWTWTMYRDVKPYGAGDRLTLVAQPQVAVPLRGAFG